MKLLKSAACVALLTACYLPSSAQAGPLPVNEPNYNKPKVFSDLPEKQNVHLADLELLLDLPIGGIVNSTIADGFLFKGTVVSKSNPSNAKVKSVVVKSSTRKGVTLTFSRLILQDGTSSYIGRLLSKDAGDVMEIVREGKNYVISKKGYHDLVNE